jgi:hypothetical protein
MSSDDQLRAFILRLKEMLLEERRADVEQAAILLSNCSSKVLEQSGLALLNLAVLNVNTGLGGKRSPIYHPSELVLSERDLVSLIELERPLAFHPTPQFPTNSFRYFLRCLLLKGVDCSSETWRSCTNRRTDLVCG